MNRSRRDDFLLGHAGEGVAWRPVCDIVERGIVAVPGG